MVCRDTLGGPSDAEPGWLLDEEDCTEGTGEGRDGEREESEEEREREGELA